jgi:Tfp pilus assembly protein PilF
LFGASLFGVHPLVSEAVNYIAARFIMVCTFFYLSSLILLLNAVDAPMRRGRFGWGLLAIPMFAGAFLSKEVGFTLPPAALLMLGVFRFGFTGFRTLLNRHWRCAILMGAGLTTLAISLGLPSVVSEALRGFRVSDVIQYWIVQAGILVRYLGLSIWPHPSLLNVHHDLSGHDPLSIQAFVPVAAIGMLIVFSVRALSRSPVIGFGLLWWFLLHAPTSICPRPLPMVEYRNYLPMVGLTWLVAWAGLRIPFHKTGRSPMGIAMKRALALSLLLFLALATYSRNRVWSTDLELWSDAWVKSPESSKTNSALAAAFLRARNPHPALFYAHRSLTTKTKDKADHDVARLIAGAAAFSLNDLETAEPMLRQALQASRGFVRQGANFWYGRYLMARHDEDRALSYLRQSATGRLFEVPSRLALGLLFARRQEWDRSVHELSLVLAQAPNHPEALLILAQVEWTRGRREIARDLTSRLQNIAPENPHLAQWIATMNVQGM